MNGSVNVECVLLYTFLDVSSDYKFRKQLQSLQSQDIVPFLKDSCCYYCYDDDEVELQTDGNQSGHLQNGEPVFNRAVNKEAIRIIAAQLAMVGDQFDKEIKARVVNDLVQHFLNENLSGEEITQCMSEAVEGLARAAIPSDMEWEKAMLVLAMVLTKKIANTMPSLLHRVFSTTVNYISQQLHNYIVRMPVVAGMIAEDSPSEHSLERMCPERKPKPSAKQQERGQTHPTDQAVKQPLPCRNDQVPAQIELLFNKHCSNRPTCYLLYVEKEQSMINGKV
ncbi:LOW QUALITY PROTEIN: BH3-interacting domain death agonist-like [Podargus strigoides]